MTLSTCCQKKIIRNSLSGIRMCSACWYTQAGVPDRKEPKKGRFQWTKPDKMSGSRPKFQPVKRSYAGCVYRCSYQIAHKVREECCCAEMYKMSPEEFIRETTIT